MGDRLTVADLAPTSLLLAPRRGPRPRVAMISLHTSPTAALGHSANGGMNVYVRELCRSLSATGIATDVFTRVPAGSPRRVEHLTALARIVSLPAGAPELSKYELEGEVGSFAEQVIDFAAAEEVAYDAIHSHYWLSGAAAAILRPAWDVPWAHTAHTLALVKNRQLAPGDHPEPHRRELVERDVAQAADLLVVSTPAEAQDLAELYGVAPDRCAVVAPGVDLDRFRATPRREARAKLRLQGLRPLLFVGRLERLKGVEIAIRAFALAAAGHPSARLLVLGGDSAAAGESELARLTGIAAGLGISGRVRFLGSVPHSDLPLYYSASEALLMPSYNESFGLVGLEAQACGCPVVATDVAGLASVVRHEVTGFLVAGHDPASYAAYVARLLDSPELSTQLGRRGTLLAQRFGWDRSGSLLMEALEPLLRPAGQLRVQPSARHE